MIRGTDVEVRRFEGNPADLPVAVVGWVAFDTETSGLHPDDGARVSVVSVAWFEPDDGVVYHAAWPFGQGPADRDLGRYEWTALCGWLLAADGLIGHNLKFDLTMMAAGSIHGHPGVELSHLAAMDTMIAAKEIWPNKQIALKPLSVALFGEDADAEQAALKPHLGPKTNPRFDLVPWEVMREYAEKDASLTLRLWLELRWRMEEGYAGAEWVSREVQVMIALYRMEQAGLPYDPAFSLEIADTLQHEADELAAKLPFDPKDAKKWYFGRELPGSMGMAPIHTTPKGAPSMTAQTLDVMVDKKIPHAATLAKLNQAKTALKMWYKPYALKTDPAGRLRCSFRQVASGWSNSGGTASGRFSVERVNLQAIPQDYRIKFDHPTPRAVIGKAAAALEGWQLWELDLAQAELRVAALWAGCQTMLDAISNGDDLHGATATQLFDVTPDSPDWGFRRQVAKRANFSLIFGSGAATFQQMIAKETGVYLSTQEAKRIVYGWQDIYPEYGDEIHRVMDFADANQYVDLANGKRRWFRAGEQTHKAMNQRVQASLAEMGKSWLVRSSDYLQPYQERGLEAGIGRAGLLMVIHDSQVVLLPEATAADEVAKLRQFGLDVWADMFPGVPGDIEAKEW